MKNRQTTQRSVKEISILILVILTGQRGWAQNGNAGIDEATNQVKSYFDSGCNLMYAIGAVIVYQKWNSGDHDTSKVAAAWFGSCVFLVIVATVLKSFFGL